MRYSEDEETVLVGEFESGSDVTIEILCLETDKLVTLDKDECEESGVFSGVYKFSTKYIDKSTVPVYANLLYRMTDGVDTYMGKFVYGGWLDNIEVEATIDTKPLEDKLDLHDDIVNTKLDIINARMS
jgi:hypothetical protein